MQEVVDRYYHGEVDGDHLREPRDFMLSRGAREIEQIEFRHRIASFLTGAAMLGKNTSGRFAQRVGIEV